MKPTKPLWQHCAHCDCLAEVLEYISSWSGTEQLHHLPQCQKLHAAISDALSVVIILNSCLYNQTTLQ